MTHVKQIYSGPPGLSANQMLCHIGSCYFATVKARVTFRRRLPDFLFEVFPSGCQTIFLTGRDQSNKMYGKLFLASGIAPLLTGANTPTRGIISTSVWASLCIITE